MATPLRFTLLGVGAMNSPRYNPAGLLISYAGRRVVFDGGPGAEPDDGALDAWLVTDDKAELIRQIRSLAGSYAVTPRVGDHRRGALRVRAVPVVHTSHPTYCYLIELGEHRVVWAPEFWEFPSWAAGADLMFADAAAWNRPVRFAGGVGGHASVQAVAEHARKLEVARLVFAHIGRPSIRAQDTDVAPPYGEWGREGRRYTIE